MSNSKNAVWYHCGRCGSLFESDFSYRPDRTCELCGKQPNIGVWPVPDEAAAAVNPEVSAFAKRGEATKLNESGQRAVKKKRRSNTMMKIVVIWTFLMFLAVWLRHHYTKTENGKENQGKIAAKMTTGTLADERVAILNKALPDCHRALGGFLSAGTPEARNQFVLDPINTAGKMATFYRSNLFPKVEVAKLSRIGQEIIQVGDSWMIKTRWKEQDGKEFDAIFGNESGTWRLDWAHFNQYSEYPWALFLAGEGPAKAEFRLLARQRLGKSENERHGSRLSLSLITPVFGKPRETGMASPEFVIDRRSDDGLLFSAAVKSREEGKAVFGQKLEPLEEPGLVRLRVSVKRTEVAGKRSFTLEKIHACHWIESDLSGYDLKLLRDDLFGN